VVTIHFFPFVGSGVVVLSFLLQLIINVVATAKNARCIFILAVLKFSFYWLSHFSLTRKLRGHLGVIAGKKHKIRLKGSLLKNLLTHFLERLTGNDGDEYPGSKKKTALQ
jgi:hypothetical protein